MTDEESIHQIISKYGVYLDDHRVDEFVELWADDAVWHLDKDYHGRQEIAKHAREIIARDERLSKHVSLNTVLEVDHDAAIATTDWLFLRADADGRLSVHLMGRYDDRFVKQGGHWRIASRRSVRAT